MGRTNRSRKQKDRMNRVKRERNAKKELARLKKTLGIVDDAEMKEQVQEVTTVKTAQELKKEQLLKEEKEVLAEIEAENEKGENIKVINEKTKKVHIFNTKTMRDQYGTLPSWKRPRRTEKKIRKREKAFKRNFRYAWNTKVVPLD